MLQSRRFLTAIVISLSVVAGSALSGCSLFHKPPADTSQLSAAGQHDLTLIQVVKGVEDVSTAVITANKLSQLSDVATARILTINKQVLDVTQANPADFKSAALLVLKNARDALPPALAALVTSYLDQVNALLQEVR